MHACMHIHVFGMGDGYAQVYYASSVGFRGARGAIAPLLPTLRNTKNSMYLYKNALKHSNSYIKCHFYTLQNMTTHTFRG